jgi:hypothetical protein
MSDDLRVDQSRLCSKAIGHIADEVAEIEGLGLQRHPASRNARDVEEAID